MFSKCKHSVTEKTCWQGRANQRWCVCNAALVDYLELSSHDCKYWQNPHGFHSGRCIFSDPLKIVPFPTRVIILICGFQGRINQYKCMATVAVGFKISCLPLAKIPYVDKIYLRVFFQTISYLGFIILPWVICQTISSNDNVWVGRLDDWDRSSFQIPSSTSLTFRRRSMNKILLFKKSCCLVYHTDFPQTFDFLKQTQKYAGELTVAVYIIEPIYWKETSSQPH